MLCGNKVECSVCNKKFRKLLPYGYENPRDNALCPNCLSLERHRMIWYYLKNKTDFFTASYKVLHIAPEQHFYARFKKMANLEYVTADMESPLADIKLDVQQMPFEDNSFDVVMCNHVFEHVPNDKKAMREILRVLKPGGWAIMQVPQREGLKETYEDLSITDPKERTKHFGQYDHLRIYGDNYGEILKSQGFDLKEINLQTEIGKELSEKFGFPKNELLYVGFKPIN